MPETSINKNTGSVFSHHDVRFSRKPWMIQSIAVSMYPQPLAHNNFWFCVLAVNSCHIFMALLWGMRVAHRPSIKRLLIDTYSFLFRRSVKIYGIGWA
jgi:hypothetical protein